MFHRRQWQIEGEKFNPRDPNMTHFKGQTDEETYLKVLYGFTVLTQRCIRCDRRTTEHVIGRTNGAL